MRGMMEIRQLESMQEMDEAEDTMQSAFDASDRAVIPDHVFKICAEKGIVLGAYQEGKQVGMAFGFRGIDNRTVYLHTIGVRKDYTSQGIGEELMRNFLAISRDQDMKKVSLTYDPLLAANAALYLRKAGGKVSEYRQNMYGDQSEGSNVGETPTDRFIVEYGLESAQVRDFISGEPRQRSYDGVQDILIFDSLDLISEEFCIEECKNNITATDIPESEVLGVQVPDDLSLLKKKGGEARARYATREVFEKLLAEDYVITDFISGSGESEQNKYILTKS